MKWTDEERRKFLVRLRELFRAGWDEPVWQAAREEIQRLRPSLAAAALERYGMMHGGERSRFFPGQFMKAVAEMMPGNDEAMRAAKIRIARETAQAERSELERRIDDDWAERRAEIGSASAEALRAAFAVLEGAGWRRPAGEPSGWPRSWVLAMSDLVTDRINYWRWEIRETDELPSQRKKWVHYSDPCTAREYWASQPPPTM